MDGMKPGTVELDGCSLQLSYSQIVKPNQRGLLLEITNLLTQPSKRRNNCATHLMREVCDQADQHGITLMLMPQADGNDGPNSDTLEAWYSREFDFKRLQSDSNLMIRLPSRVAERLASANDRR